MPDGYEEDLAMYEESAEVKEKRLDIRVLMQPIREIGYPENPASVGPDDKVRDALDLMAEKRIGALLVVDEGKVVGIFGERDMLVKGLYQEERLDHPVRSYMAPDPVCLTPHDSIACALSRMTVGGYRHIPLVAPGGVPAGLLTMRDMMAFIVSYFPDEVLNLPPHSDHRPPERNVEGG